MCGLRGSVRCFRFGIGIRDRYIVRLIRSSGLGKVRSAGQEPDFERRARCPGRKVHRHARRLKSVEVGLNVISSGL